MHRDLFKAWALKLLGELHLKQYPMPELALTHLSKEYASDSSNTEEEDEINAMIATKCLTVESPEGPRSIPITVRGCFDLVAARGIRGGGALRLPHTDP